MGATIQNEGLQSANPARMVLAYLRLTKPGISIFIGFTSATAVLFQNNFAMLTWYGQLTIFLSSYLSSAGSAVFNHYFESDLDRLMSRTKNRPFPEGIINDRSAILLSAVLVALGLGIATYFHGLFTAGYLAAGSFSYILLYTVISKRRTVWNIPIGGLCGMFAALAGATSTTGSISLSGIAFAAILYLWSSPHFWSLAIVRAEDYRKSGIPMLPVVYGNYKTALAILTHTLALPPMAIIFYADYRIAAMITLGASVGFVLHSFRLLLAVLKAKRMVDGDKKVGSAELPRDELRVVEYARQTFIFSLIFLPMVYLGFWFDSVYKNMQ